MTKLSFCIKGSSESNVFLAGLFNDWSPTSHQMKFNKRSGNFSLTIELEPGVYPYKFVVDGVWKIDPDNYRFDQDGKGGLNSLAHIGSAKS